MKSETLFNASAYIVARNVSENVCTAAINWISTTSHLALVYEFSSVPSENDLEHQELALTEILAEFSDIATAECLSSVLDIGMPVTGVTVYSRSL